MPEAGRRSLQRDLLRAGVAVRHVSRLVEELEDHMQDLVDAGIEDGLDIQAAKAAGFAALGSNKVIVAAAASRPELQCWANRWPRLRHALAPLLLIAMVPLMPVAIVAEYGAAVARWTVATILGGVLTAATFFLLQLSISIS